MMLYQKPSFTLPAKSPVTSEKNWDRAFLSKEKFQERYGESSESITPIESVPDATGFSD
jgi:hypothetical protein